MQKPRARAGGMHDWAPSDPKAPPLLKEPEKGENNPKCEAEAETILIF